MTDEHWYINPGHYLVACFKFIARGFVEGGGEGASQAQKKGEGGFSQFFLGLFVGLFMAVIKAAFMLAGWALQTITFLVWKLTEPNRKG